MTLGTLRTWLLCCLLALPCGGARAQEGRYAASGSESGGVVLLPAASGWRVIRPGAREPWEGSAEFTPRGLQLRGPDGVLCGCARPDADGAYEVTWLEDGRVRRERWEPRPRARIPLSLAVLRGAERLPGVADGAERELQERVLAQLAGVFGPLGLEFVPTAPLPLPVSGAGLDADRDGRLDRREVEALRDRLERDGLKRPGRVVLVLTAAPFVGRGCLGWTLGDAPATPGTLRDLNDNLSLIRVEALESSGHTAAHEVAHQLGLDDLRPDNRRALRQPERADHLMQSGGQGEHLDASTVLQLLPQLDDLEAALQGRRALQVALPAVLAVQGPPEGLHPPALKTRAAGPGPGRGSAP